MNPLFEQLEDPAFADDLRNSDHSVFVEPAELTNRLVRRRSRQRSNRVLIAMAIPLVLIVFGMGATGLLKETNSDPFPSEMAVQQTISERQETESLPTENLSTFLSRQDELVAELGRLRQVERKMETLRDLKLRQEWVFRREFVSRTEIENTISSYEF